jgi:aminoglycoside phosphotransferase (APT) family kinase protein
MSSLQPDIDIDSFVLTQNCRQSDQLPLAKLVNFLTVQLPDFINTQQLHVEQFSAGASNITYRLSNGQDSVILRRPPSGTKAKSAHDMVREHNVLTQLQSVYSLSPKPILVCEDASIIGEQFFIMQEISGLTIGKNLPVELDANAQNQLCRNFVKSFAELHQVDITQPNLASLGKPEGYVKRQLTGWHHRYNQAKTDDVAAVDDIAKWLQDNLPMDSGYQSLVHNDFKFDNLIVDKQQPEKIVGVLDWEMTTLGDPLLDLGCSLAYWVESTDHQHLQAIRMMPTHLPGMMSRAQVFECYCQLREIPLIDMRPYYVFGLFRLAAIAQQIYYRFYHGQTDNPKFKNFGQLVNILVAHCGAEISAANHKK